MYIYNVLYVYDDFFSSNNFFDLEKSDVYSHIIFFLLFLYIFIRFNILLYVMLYNEI